MDFNVSRRTIDNIDKIELQKMIFVYNALENDWTIFKKDDCFIFKKKHEDKEEVFSESFLCEFLEKNLTRQHKKS